MSPLCEFDLVFSVSLASTDASLLEFSFFQIVSSFLGLLGFAGLEFSEVLEFARFFMLYACLGFGGRVFSQVFPVFSSSHVC